MIRQILVVHGDFIVGTDRVHGRGARLPMRSASVSVASARLKRRVSLPNCRAESAIPSVIHFSARKRGGCRAKTQRRGEEFEIARRSPISSSASPRLCAQTLHVSFASKLRCEYHGSRRSEATAAEYRGSGRHGPALRWRSTDTLFRKESSIDKRRTAGIDSPPAPSKLLHMARANRSIIIARPD